MIRFAQSPWPRARPIFDAAVIDQHDVLKAVARHVGDPDAGVGEVDVRELFESPAFNQPYAIPAFLRIIEEALQARTGADGVGDAIAIEIDQPDLRVFQVEARGMAIRLERVAVP